MRKAADNKLYVNCRFRTNLEVYSPQQPRWYSTGNRPEVGNCIYFRNVMGHYVCIIRNHEDPIES